MGLVPAMTGMDRVNPQMTHRREQFQIQSYKMEQPLQGGVQPPILAFPAKKRA
jgi:hypothetical protein